MFIKRKGDINIYFDFIIMKEIPVEFIINSKVFKLGFKQFKSLLF
jgi:hypothetical protein